MTPEQAPPLFADGSFRFREGLFETALLLNGKLQLAREHFDRLSRGIRQRYGAIPSWLHFDNFMFQILETAVAKQGTTFRIRLQVTKHQTSLDYLIEAIPVERTAIDFNTKGYLLNIAEKPLKRPDDFGNLKQIDSKLYREGARLAAEANLDDVLLSPDGLHVSESSIANIFWVKDGILFTPPLSAGCVAGVMRQHIINRLHGHFPLQEQLLSKQALYEADEVFLTNAIRRIKWVAAIGEYTYSNRLTGSIHNYLFG